MKALTFLGSLALIALLTVTVYGQGGVLWQRFGLDFEETHLAVSKGTGEIVTLGASEAQTWPLSLASWPVRMPRSEGLGISICAPFIPTSDSELMVVSNDTLKAWNPSTNRVRPVSTLQAATITYLEVAPDGSKVILIAHYGDTTNLILVDRSSGSFIWTLPDAGNIARFSPDGKLLLCSLNQGLDLIDIATKRIIHRYTQFVESPFGLAWSPTDVGLFAVSGDFRGLMDTSGDLIDSGSLGQSIQFSPDGKYVISDALIAYRVSDWSRISLGGNESSVATAFLNNDTVVSLGIGNLSLYDVSKGYSIGTLSCSPTPFLAYSGDGSELLSSDAIFEASTGVTLGSATVQSTTAGILNHDGSLAILEDEMGNIVSYSIISSKATVLRSAISDTGGTAILSFAPGDSIFASAFAVGLKAEDDRDFIELWNPNSGILKKLKTSNPYPVQALSFSADGEYLAASLSYSKTYVWRLADDLLVDSVQAIGNKIFFLPGDSGLILPDPANDPFAPGFCFGFYSLTGQAAHYVPVPDLSANRFAFSQDGKRCYAIYTSGTFGPESDHGVQVIDVQTGSVLHTLSAPDSGMNEWIEVNPASGDIAVGGEDIIVYKALGSDAVKSPSESFASIQAIASASRITIRVPGTGNPGSGKVFVYNALGVCCFTSDVRVGERSITTGALPAGDYFIVFQTGSGGKYFTKVSLFQ